MWLHALNCASPSLTETSKTVVVSHKVKFFSCSRKPQYFLRISHITALNYVSLSHPEFSVSTRPSSIFCANFIIIHENSCNCKIKTYVFIKIMSFISSLSCYVYQYSLDMLCYKSSWSAYTSRLHVFYYNHISLNSGGCIRGLLSD